MNDAERDALEKRIKVADELKSKLYYVRELLEALQGNKEIEESELVAARIIGKPKKGETVFTLRLGVMGGTKEIAWDDSMRPALAKLLRERARALVAEYEAL